MDNPASSSQKANRALIKKLALAVVGMFAFAFALVPLYNVFCDLTGLGGKTGGRVAATDFDQLGADLSRTIVVEFTADVHAGLPWRFAPEVNKMEVHPGEIQAVNFVAKNTADIPVTGRAIPSVTPGLAAQFFDKTECFCFEEQTLKPKEVMDMPVRFIIDPKLPKEIEQITLAYTFYKKKE
ncbi:cytochrome c oxidase assembly protein [Magnetococcales bacterium HHB-1]